MEIDELAVKITGDSTSLQTAMEDATESMGKLGINTSALTRLLGAAGLTAALKMAYDAADKMVQAFRDDETAQLKYNAALAASAVITAQGKKALDEYVPVFASLAGIAEADTQSQIARLAAYGRTDAQIKTMMETALGMSTVLDMDVNTALTQLNMTFSGTIGRLGQQIPAMKDLTAEQLKNGDGIKLLNEKYGEFAGTLKDSTDVSIKNFENAYSDLMSTMGASIAGTIKTLRDSMTGLFRDIIAQTQDSNSGLEIFATGFNNFVNIFKQAALSIVGKGNIFTAIDEAINHTQQKINELIVIYSGLEDPIQKRIRLEKEAAEKARQEAEATASKVAAAAQEAADAQIKSFQKAQEAYRAELAATETRVKAGLITEQDAADAKYNANKKLIDDLIALGYTGDAASKQIGDQALAAAIARNANLYANTKENVDNILTEEAKILAQQQEVAEWEAAYLAKKKASAEAAAEIQRRLVNTRLEATEQATIKEDAAEEALQATVAAGLTSTAQHAEQMAARRTAADAAHWDAVENMAEATRAAEVEASEEAADAEAFAAEQARAAEKLAEQEAAEYAKKYTEAITATKQAGYAARLASMEKTHDAEEKAEERLQLIVTEQSGSAAQHAEQAAERRANTEQNFYAATANIAAREAEEQAIAEAAAAEVSRKLREQTIAKMVSRQLAATEAVDKAQSDAQEAEEKRQIAAEVAADDHAKAVRLIEGRLLTTRLKNIEAVDAKDEKARADADARAEAAAEVEKRVAEIKIGLQNRGLANAESVHEKAAAAEDALNEKKKKGWESYEAYLDEMRAKEITADAAALAEKEKTFKDAFQKIADAADDAVNNFVKIGTALNTVLESASKKQQEAVDAALKTQLDAYEAEKQAALEAAGLADKTTLETLKERVDAAYAAGDAEEIAAAEAALKKQEIIEEYDAKAVAATKKAEYEKAVIKYKADIAQYGVNMALAVAQGALAIVQAFAQLGPIAGAIAAVAIGATTAAQIVVMENNKPTPPPALALGGVARGSTWVGERGAELVDLPAGSYVHDAQESKRIAAERGNSNSTFIFNSPKALTPSEMKRQFRIAQRRAAFMGAAG